MQTLLLGSGTKHSTHWQKEALKWHTPYTAQHTVVQRQKELLALERSARVGAAKKVAHTTTAAAVSENNSNTFDRSQCLVNTRGERIR